MVLDASLINTQQYKVRIKGKVEQSREMSSALPYTSVADFTTSYIVSSNYFHFIIIIGKQVQLQATINLQIVISFQVFRFNTNNF